MQLCYVLEGNMQFCLPEGLHVTRGVAENNMPSLWWPKTACFFLHCSILNLRFKQELRQKCFQGGGWEPTINVLWLVGNSKKLYQNAKILISDFKIQAGVMAPLCSSLAAPLVSRDCFFSKKCFLRMLASSCYCDVRLITWRTAVNIRRYCDVYVRIPTNSF